MIWTKVVLKMKIDILCPITIFENRALYEIMWKNIVQPDRLQIKIWRMRFACWMPKATNAHSEHVILLLSHCNNGCNKTPQYYVIRTVLLLVSGWQCCNTLCYSGV